MVTRIRFFAAPLLAGFALLLLGCAIDTEKGDKKNNVTITSPLGNLQVRPEADPRDTGLSVYPNARPKHDTDEDKGRANVNIATPFFGLKVVAISYESDDAPDKLIAFYRKDLARYGRVVECKGDHQGSSAKSNGKNDLKLTLDCDDSGGEGVELKAGEGERQRIVGIKPRGSGSEFALVYLQMHGQEKDRETL
jgi:hypothetical protein